MSIFCLVDVKHSITIVFKRKCNYYYFIINIKFDLILISFSLLRLKLY